MAVVFAVDAQGTLNQKPSARTVVHAARSLLSCAFWCGMGGILPPESVFARRPPFSLGFPTRAARRRSRRPPGCFR
ncbi:MAG: hypothetical protein OXH92_11405 [Bryobacterales bacterium]|nr:hypothetical protein [Bryobacterales bacterium]